MVLRWIMRWMKEGRPGKGRPHMRSLPNASLEDCELEIPYPPTGIAGRNLRKLEDEYFARAL